MAVGGAGDDVLDGNFGTSDIIDGGPGSDTVTYVNARRPVSIDLAVQLTYDGVVLDQLISIENGIGSQFDDLLQGDTGVNRLDGGAGSDTVTYSRSARGVSIDLGSNGAYDGIAYDTLADIENAIGSGFDDILQGNGGSNVFDGGGGLDLVSYFSSARGVVIDLAAGASFDGVVLDALANIEQAQGSRFDDVLEGDAGSNILDGGEGSDTVRYLRSTSGVIIDLGAQLTYDGRVLDGLISIENAIGSSFNDTIKNGAGANRIDGGDGTDTVDYSASRTGVLIDLGRQTTFDGSSVDILSGIENAVGSAFNDVFQSSLGNNVITGGGGVDLVSYVTASLPIRFVAFSRTVTGGADLLDRLFGIARVAGSGLDDIFLGSSTAPVTGQDVYVVEMDGGIGNDTISYDFVTVETDTVVTIDLQTNRASGITGPTTRIDQTLLNFENVVGSRASDMIVGNSFDNILEGGPSVSPSGSSVVIRDTLTGGAGLDTFRFVRGAADGDVVTDFAGNGAAQGDRLEFRGFGTAAQGATLTMIDATRYRINSSDGAAQEVITIANGAAIDASDYVFV